MANIKVPSQKAVIGAAPTVQKLEAALESGNVATAKKLYAQVKDKVTPKLKENLKKRLDKIA